MNVIILIGTSIVLAGGLWSLYSLVTGTAAIGMWVTAHECGHGAFSDNRKLQDAVGYVFHSLLLVPYYSWQRSHAIHHANTNHILDGETHVPPLAAAEGAGPSPDRRLKKILTTVSGNTIGTFLYGSLQLLLHLGVGWPAYILFGATGGPSRGITNHFIPFNMRKPFSQSKEKLKELFPAGQKLRVWLSDIGVAAVLGGLYLLSQRWGGAAVAAAYGGPLLVVNAW